MAETSTSSSRGLIWAGIAVILLIALFVVRSTMHDKVDVHAVQATHADINSAVSTNGKVEPVEDFQAHASAPGVVQRLFVQVGDHVQRGAELMRLDDSDARKNVAAAQAQLEAAVTTLKNMQGGGTQDEMLTSSADLAAARTQQQQAAASLASTQALQAKGSASANEVASARQRVADADARVAQLQARRKGRYSSGDIASQQAQVTQAQVALSAARSAYAAVDIHAPFAGTVYSVPVAQYDFVQGGEALLNMADLNHIQVRAYFDEPEIGKLAPGQPVKIVWDAKLGTVWHGHILRAPSTIISYGTRNVGECIISVDDARGDLLPNTNVTVTVTTSQKIGVLSIPREALRPDEKRNFVLRIVDGKLKNTEVQVGSVNLTRVEITGGLKDGDALALSAVDTKVELKDGMQVKVLP